MGHLTRALDWRLWSFKEIEKKRSWNISEISTPFRFVYQTAGFRTGAGWSKPS